MRCFFLALTVIVWVISLAKLVGIVDNQISSCSDDLVVRHIGRAEAAHESRQPVSREDEAGTDHLFHFSKSLIVATGFVSKHLHRFILKKIAGCVDAIDADVIERSTPNAFCKRLFPSLTCIVNTELKMRRSPSFPEKAVARYETRE